MTTEISVMYGSEKVKPQSASHVYRHFQPFLFVLWNPGVVVSTATLHAFHARVRGSFPGLGGLKEKQIFLPHLLVKLSIVGSLRAREVACSASDLQGLIVESYV